jgi:[ribosomal protein S5]-alanine N-acetyltransferase
MEKVGMKYEGILRQQMFSKGRFDDMKLYAILREDWENLSK